MQQVAAVLVALMDVGPVLEKQSSRGWLIVEHGKGQGEEGVPVFIVIDYLSFALGAGENGVNKVVLLFGDEEEYKLMVVDFKSPVGGPTLAELDDPIVLLLVVVFEHLNTATRLPAESCRFCSFRPDIISSLKLLI